MTWTPEHEQFVRDSYARMPARDSYARMPARDIAKQIGPWCSKSAVIGKARRLGLCGLSRANRLARSRAARAISTARKRQPKSERPTPAPKPERTIRDRPVTVAAAAGVTYATFISRSRPGDSARAIEAVATRAAAKQVRWCAWRPCDCVAEPGRMFCRAHERRAEELRS